MARAQLRAQVSAVVHCGSSYNGISVFPVAVVDVIEVVSELVVVVVLVLSETVVEEVDFVVVAACPVCASRARPRTTRFDWRRIDRRI